MRAIILTLIMSLALVSTDATPASAEALHAPRFPLASVVRITPPTGCEGPVAGDKSLLSWDGQHQAYRCTNSGGTSFILYNSRRRQIIPMFGLPNGWAEPVFVSDKGNHVAVLSETPIPPGSDPIVGEWALYLFDRQSGRTRKIFEDDVDTFGEVLGDTECPGDEIVRFGKPTVVNVSNRGRTLLRFDNRETAGGACASGTYIELLR